MATLPKSCLMGMDESGEQERRLMARPIALMVSMESFERPPADIRLPNCCQGQQAALLDIQVISPPSAAEPKVSATIDRDTFGSPLTASREIGGLSFDF